MTTTIAAPIATGTWTTDPVHSSAEFRVRHFGLTWLRGGFGQFDLAATVAEDRSISIEGGTDVASVTFTNEQLIGHLQSPDFFDAQLHPRLTFRSTSVDLREDGSVLVQGELTLRGITKAIELTGQWTPATEGLGGDQRFGLELQGELDRFDYGIAWAATLPAGADVVGRTVRLHGEFELVQA